MGASSGIVLSQGLGRLRWRYRVGHRRGNALSECYPWGDVGQVAQETRSPGGHRLIGRKGPCPALFLRMGELVQTQAGSPHHPLPRPDDRPSPRLTPGDTAKKPHPSHCPSIPPAWTTLPEVLRGPQGRGSLGLSGVGRGRHVPPLSANAEPCGEVTCRCLALLCAPGSVGAQSVARRLGPSRWVRGSRRRWRRRLQAGGSERDAAGGRGRVLSATPCWRAAGGAAAPEGLAGGDRSALCVARAEPRLCPCSPGARLWWGGGAACWASSVR